MPRWLPYTVAALFAVYFPLALWSKAAWVDPSPKGTIVVQLYGPFEMVGHVAINRWQIAKLGGFGDDDTIESDNRSPVVIYENSKPLGPAHSTFAEMRDTGKGRFYFSRTGFLFTATDNSDPNSNGRRYWAVKP